MHSSVITQYHFITVTFVRTTLTQLRYQTAFHLKDYSVVCTSQCQQSDTKWIYVKLVVQCTQNCTIYVYIYNIKYTSWLVPKYNSLQSCLVYHKLVLLPACQLSATQKDCCIMLTQMTCFLILHQFCSCCKCIGPIYKNDKLLILLIYYVTRIS